MVRWIEEYSNECVRICLLLLFHKAWSKFRCSKNFFWFFYSLCCDGTCQLSMDLSIEQLNLDLCTQKKSTACVRTTYWHRCSWLLESSTNATKTKISWYVCCWCIQWIRNWECVLTLDDCCQYLYYPKYWIGKLETIMLSLQLNKFGTSCKHFCRN